MPVRPIIYVSWTDHHRGADLMRHLDGSYLVPASWSGRLPWPARYAMQALATVVTILRRRPRAVVFMCPPIPAGAASLLGARIVGAQCWADSHSGTFNNPRWARFSRLTDAVLRRCSGTVFHNYPQAREHAGCSPRVLCVTTDGFQDRPETTADVEPYVVIPASYGFDEPIDEVLEAAGRIPDVRFVFTGRATDAVREGAPPNAEFSGFVEEDDYHRLVAGAAAVVCLTTREGTMQGGVLEALEHRRPSITSDTDALREWSDRVPGVLLIEDHDPATIAAAVGEVAQHARERWTDAAAEGHDRTARRAAGELEALRVAIGPDAA